MSAKFGTSGLRGLSTELKGSISALYATAFGKFLLDRSLVAASSEVAVGRDFRESSPEIAATVMGALERIGLIPIDCGAVPTPALALYAMKRRAAAIMITGSHIPADRNGIKFYTPAGEIGKSDEAAITTLAGELASDASANLVVAGCGEDRFADVAALFLARNKAILNTGALTGLRVGVYQHSTVARDMFVEVLAHYGADVVVLGRSEVFIPVDTEAVSPDTIAKLAHWTREHGLDAIVSADGDGDRPLVADESGVPLRGDLLGLVAARFLGAHVIATPVTSNSGIELAGEFAVTRTRVGSPFVISAMDDALKAGEAGVLGFEANGGLMLASEFVVDGRVIAPLPTRDSFLPALAILSFAAARQVPLSRVVEDFSLPVALADRLENFATERSTALMAYLRASPDNLSEFLRPLGVVADTSDIDGLRVVLADGRIIHLRPSGNAPEMRCYVEAKSQTEAEALLAEGLKTIASWKGA